MSDEEKLIEEAEGEEEQTKIKCCRISTAICCAMYFFLSCRDSLTIFLVPFFTSLGLSVAESGCLYSVQTFSILFSRLWVWVSRRTGWRKTCFLGLCVGCIVTVYLVPAVAQRKELHSKSFSGSLFINMLLLMITNAIFYTPIKGIADSFVVQIYREREANIGMLRIFCSIGLAFSCFLSGLSADIYAHNSDKGGTKILSKYMGVFYANIPFYVFTVITGVLAESKGKWDMNKNDEVKFIKKRKRGVCRVCSELPESAGTIIRKRGNIVLLLSAFVVGSACGTRHAFLFQFLQDDMQSTAAQMGLSYVFLGVGQVIGYLSAETVMDVIGGPLITFELSILGFLPSYLLLNTLNIYTIFFTQVLVGVCTAFFWFGCIGYAKEINEERSYEPLFVYFNWVFNWIGGFIAALIGGGLYETYSASTLFQVVGYSNGVWMVLVTCFFHFVYPELQRRKIQILEEDPTSK